MVSSGAILIAFVVLVASTTLIIVNLPDYFSDYLIIIIMLPFLTMIALLSKVLED